MENEVSLFGKEKLWNCVNQMKTIRLAIRDFKMVSEISDYDSPSPPCDKVPLEKIKADIVKATKMHMYDKGITVNWPS